MRDPAWKDNYQSTQPLDVRHAIARYATEPRGEFGIDFVRHLSDTDRVLDAGCGTGVHISALMQREPKAQYWAIDASDAMVSATRETCLGHGRLNCAKHPIEQLPFDDEFFTWVMCFHVLYHVADISKALSSMRRVLTTSGTCVITTVAKGTGNEFRMLHNNACRHLHLEPFVVNTTPVERFDTETSVPLVRRVFPNAALHLRYSTLQFSSPEPAIEYYRSLEYYREVERSSPVSATALIEKMANEIQASIISHGEFQVDRNVGTWVATKT